MGIGSIGIWEILVLAVIVLVFFGPDQLPEIGRSIGQTLREFKRSMNEVKREFEEVERSASLRDRTEGRGPRPSGRVHPPAGDEVSEAPPSEPPDAPGGAAGGAGAGGTTEGTSGGSSPAGRDEASGQPAAGDAGPRIDAEPGAASSPGDGIPTFGGGEPSREPPEES